MASAHVSPDKPDNCARVLRTAIIKLFFLFTASPPPPKLSYIALYDILGAFGRRSLNLEPADLSRKELICEESELYSALQWRLRLSLLSTSHTHKLLCVYVCVCGFKLKKYLLCLSEIQTISAFQLSESYSYKKYQPMSKSSCRCSIFCHVSIFSNVNMPVFKVNDLLLLKL